MTAKLQFRLPSRGAVLAAAVVLVWGLGGCSLLGHKPSTQTPINDKAFWKGAVKTFDRLYAKLVKLLEDQYFTK
jgi:hypothetical protein